jgi:class 3 adenylate cyclase
VTPPGVQRRLAAILSADAKGYSRLMGEDEVATVRTLTAYREVMAVLIRERRGRVVDAPGDNVLAEFASVVDAVECAVELQREFKSRNAALPALRRLEFRIGINLGDVIVEGERIYGDGVNIAARVEGLAEPGGVSCSRRIPISWPPTPFWRFSTTSGASPRRRDPRGRPPGSSARRPPWRA